MAPSLLDLFRLLSAFEPVRRDLSRAPWEAYVDWAIGQGLAPLAAYNLEYRLGNCGAPEWARDRLLSIFQGSANDNVMKLVGFKRTLDDLQGRRVALVGAVSFLESLYPHVAFRPVIDLRVLVPLGEVEAFANYLRRAEFRPAADHADAAGAQAVLTDTRALVFIHDRLAPEPALDRALLERALPLRVFGPSALRLAPEDALLAQVVLMARAGFEVPLIELVDLRELVKGAPAMGGAYSAPPRAEVLRERARAWKAERALWAALQLLARLFPETAEAVAGLAPELSFPVRELLERVVVAPLAEVGRPRGSWGEERLRALVS